MRRSMLPTRSALTTTANPVVLVVATWALLWGYGATQVPAPDPVGPSDRADVRDAANAVGAHPAWRDAWSRRFPGCVALALWPQDERPVAVVTLDGRGEVARLSPGADVPAGSRVVGACR